MRVHRFYPVNPAQRRVPYGQRRMSIVYLTDYYFCQHWFCSISPSSFMDIVHFSLECRQKDTQAFHDLSLPSSDILLINFLVFVLGQTQSISLFQTFPLGQPACKPGPKRPKYSICSLGLPSSWGLWKNGLAFITCILHLVQGRK